ncbi:ankyrin repeat domain-containing protein [Zoogloea sp.]|uniref:ankyrin repeat domain-containing protein n=1 Tax=Zoogloea sp. TaxID=49181 RepID=UPI002638FE67|nr:ankyrin repeat domain-containing protein [uncultured Zoogloea sp.]
MKRLHAGLRALIVAAGLLPLLAQAYSGAGGECGNSALEAAALRGTPPELEQALDNGVRNIEKVVDQWSGDIARLYPDTAGVWRNREVRRSSREAKRQTFARWWSGCRGIRLLDVAVAGQNLANVRYLLALGVDPDAPDAQGNTLLMRCPHLEPGNPMIFTHSAPRSRSPDALEKAVAIHGLLLGHGASIARRNQHGLTALHLCNDPALVELFIRQGADASSVINHKAEPDWKAPRLLDYRVRQIIDGSPWDQEAHFAILDKILPQLTDRRLTPETARALELSCRTPGKQAACRRLARLLP